MSNCISGTPTPEPLASWTTQNEALGLSPSTLSSEVPEIASGPVIEADSSKIHFALPELWHAKWVFHAHGTRVRDLAYSADEKPFASTGKGSATEGHIIHEWKAKIRSVGRISFSPNGKTLAYSVAHPDCRKHRPRAIITVWDSATSDLLHEWSPFTENPMIAYSPDGREVAVVGRNGLEICEWATSKAVQRPNGFQRPIFDAMNSPKGAQIAISTFYGSVAFWGLTNLQASPKERSTHGFKVTEMAYSPDGARFASTIHLSRSVTIWNPNEANIILTLRVDLARIVDVTFLPNGQTIAAGTDTGINIIPLDPNVQSQRITFDSDNLVNSIACAPNKREIVAGYRDGSIRILDTARRPGGYNDPGSVKFFDATYFPVRHEDNTALKRKVLKKKALENKPIAQGSNETNTRSLRSAFKNLFS